MKYFIRIMTILFGVLFVASLGMSIYTLLSLSQVNIERSAGKEDAVSHYGVFLPENSYTFFHDVVKGAKRAGTELSCGLSFHPIGNGTVDIDMAKYSGIDGAIVFPSIPDDKARQVLSGLSQVGIPVVLIEHTIADDSPWPLVGTNNFDLGKKIGDLIAKTGIDPLHVAIVYSEKSPGIYAERELVEMGILSSVGNRLDRPLKVLKSDLNPLAAEDLTYHILRDEPSINLIVYTDTNDTLSATQVLIDMNLVGKVQIIGFGSDDLVLDYIDKGIISGSIAVHPVEIGYEAVKLLYELKSEGFSKSYVDTGVQVITRANSKEIRAAAAESAGGTQ